MSRLISQHVLILSDHKNVEQEQLQQHELITYFYMISYIHVHYGKSHVMR